MAEPSGSGPGEFETIDRLLRPLAHPQWGRGLLDDVGVVPSRPGHDLVLTKDAMVEGVHFRPDDPPDQIARKLLRVNLSDLAAKGAEPFGYMLACHWSDAWGWQQREAFARGLAQDQAAFGIALIGGDTVRTPGPASFSATLLGWTPAGTHLARDGARPGDVLLVSGCIGDGWLGLQALEGRLALSPTHLEALAARYRLPSPRLALRETLLTHARASADVSDGLAADAGRIGVASGAGVELDLEAAPLSHAAAAWLAGQGDAVAARLALVAGGDDYEVVMACAPEMVALAQASARLAGLDLTPVGRVVEGEGVSVLHDGVPVRADRLGWTHG